MTWDEGRQTNQRLRRETRWIEQIVGVQMSERRAAAATLEGRGRALRAQLLSLTEFELPLVRELQPLPKPDCVLAPEPLPLPKPE